MLFCNVRKHLNNKKLVLCIAKTSDVNEIQPALSRKVCLKAIERYLIHNDFGLSRAADKRVKRTLGAGDNFCCVFLYQPAVKFIVKLF